MNGFGTKPHIWHEHGVWVWMNNDLRVGPIQGASPVEAFRNWRWFFS